MFQDAVVKAFFSKPVRGVDRRSFTLVDAKGRNVPASVDQIGDGTWALFPDQVFLTGGQTYTARLAAGLCDEAGDCTKDEVRWRFTVSASRGEGTGDTTIPMGFPAGRAPVRTAPVVTNIAWAGGTDGLTVAFSRPVMNVTARTFMVHAVNDAAGDCTLEGAAVRGRISSNNSADAWTFKPDAALATGSGYCLTLTGDVYDLSGQALGRTITTRVKVGDLHQ